MNRGQLNGFALNGATGDHIVRVRVDAKGYARVNARGRVLAYGVVHSTPAAFQGGRLGRVEANLSVNSITRAAIVGALGRVDIRSLLAATGRAVIQVDLPPIYGRVQSKARASIGLKAHVLVRRGVGSKPQARLSAKTRLLRRGPVAANGIAKVKAQGVVYVRRWLRSPIEGRGQVFIVSAGRTEARLAALVNVRADVAAGFHVLARAPKLWSGVAFIEIDPAIYKRLPFDEIAPDARTFEVPEIMTTFDVSEQGDAMFRTPPMQPADTQDWDINFDKFFPPGDEIESVTMSVLPAMPMPPSYAFQGQRVKVWVYSGGIDRQKYKISVTATTNDGRVKQAELIVPIKEN